MNGTIHGVLCDEVRLEQGGKHIIIGVYPGDITIPEDRTQGTFSVYLTFRGFEEGMHKLGFSFSETHEADKEPVHFDFSIAQNGSANFPITSIPITLIHGEVLKFFCSVDGSKMTEVCSFPVSHPTPDAASEQP